MPDQALAISDGPLLNVKGLRVGFLLRGGAILRAVDGVDFDVRSGEVHGLVGESGCGKTVMALSVLGLLDVSGANVEEEIHWRGRNLVGLLERKFRPVGGREIAMVFQNAPASLNPALRIGTQMGALLLLHRGLHGSGAEREAERLLTAVRFPIPRGFCVLMPMSAAVAWRNGSRSRWPWHAVRDCSSPMNRRRRST